MAKIPMQFFILFIGAMVFVFYLFAPPPLLFQPLDQARVESAEVAAEYEELKTQDQASVLESADVERLLALADGNTSGTTAERPRTFP